MCGNNYTGQASSRTPYKKLRSHGITNMLGWGILMIIGAILARYFKQWDPIWFYSHTLVQSLGFVLGVAGVICGLVLENKFDADVSTHKGLGIFILVLGCLQVFLWSHYLAIFGLSLSLSLFFCLMLTLHKFLFIYLC